MSPSQILKHLLQHSGLQLDTRSIGDGFTRYRFFRSDEEADYFRSEGIFTAIGRAEAITFLQGYRAAQLNEGGQR